MECDHGGLIDIWSLESVFPETRSKVIRLLGKNLLSFVRWLACQVLHTRSKNGHHLQKDIWRSRWNWYWNSYCSHHCYYNWYHQEQTDGKTDGRKDRRTDGRSDGRTDDGLINMDLWANNGLIWTYKDGQMDGKMNRWTDEKIDRRMEGYTVGRRDEWKHRRKE